MEQLTIEHNHGVYVITDVTVTEHEEKDCYGKPYTDRTVTGTGKSGGVTNRLFSASSFTPIPVGKPFSMRLYGRVPRKDWRNMDKDWWTVNVQFCG